MILHDEKFPFTCAITQKYCGAEIQNIYIMIDNEIMTTIPVAPEIAEKFSRKVSQQIMKHIELLLKN